mgnify:CR=1 FL=1
MPRGCPSITHLSYTDDTIIFSSARPSSLNLIMKTLKTYKTLSSQQLNVHKSYFLVHDKLLMQQKTNVQRITGFVQQSFPVQYLRCPLFPGKCKKIYFMVMVQSVINKVASWRH